LVAGGAGAGLGAGRAQRQGVAHLHLDPVAVERLGEVVEGAAPHGVDHVGRVGGVARHDDDRQVAPELARLVEQLEAAHPGQLDVEDGEVEGLGLEQLERLLGAAGVGELVALRLEDPAHGAADVRLVVDDEDGPGGHAPPQGFLRSTTNGPNACCTGMSSMVLTLTWAGRETTQATTSAMSAAESGVMPA
jgi:hypothetical protein